MTLLLKIHVVLTESLSRGAFCFRLDSCSRMGVGRGYWYWLVGEVSLVWLRKRVYSLAKSVGWAPTVRVGVGVGQPLFGATAVIGT